MQVGILNNATFQATVVSVATGSVLFKPTGDCDNHSLNLTDSCTFSVTFSPAAGGTYEAPLTVSVNPDRYSVQVILEGIAGPSPTPNPADSPTQLSGTPSMALR
jgi:hypothetical protein